MLDRFNVLIIVRDHFRTFYDYGRRVQEARTQNINWIEIAVQLAVPAIIALVLWHSAVVLPENSIGTLITALAVFGALLFNLLILLYDLAGREVKEVRSEVAAARKQTVLDLHANVGFAVLLTLLTIVDLVIAAVGEKGAMVEPTSTAFFFLASLFILTLLLILRRMHLLLSSDIRKS